MSPPRRCGARISLTGLVNGKPVGNLDRVANAWTSFTMNMKGRQVHNNELEN